MPAHRRSSAVRSFLHAEPYEFVNYDVESALSSQAMARTGARGTAATMVGTWVRFGIQAVATVVLARLLSPGDFGVFAMVSVISGLGELLRDLGLSFAVVQARDLREHQASTLFWYSSGTGAAVAVVLVALTPAVENFYHQSRIVYIMPVLAVGVFIASLGAQHIALLDRALGFTRVMLSDVISSSVACIAAIVVGVLGGGYWSLVVMLTGQSVLRTALAWVNVSWRPGRVGRWQDVRELVSFGSHNFLSQVLNYSSRNADDVVVGRLYGAAVLGQYVQAYNLLLLPLQQINAPLQRVAIPLLSRSLAIPRLYRSYFRMSLRLMTLVLVPTFAVSAVLSKGLVHLVLGSKWGAAADIFRILCIAGVSQSLGYSISWLFVSSGNARRQLVWSLISRPLVIASFFVGAVWGVKGVALAYSIASLIVVFPAFAYALKDTPAKASDVLSGVRDVLIIVPVTCSVAYFSYRTFVDHGGSIDVSFIGAAGLSIVAYLALWVAIPSCRATARSVGLLLRREGPDSQTATPALATMGAPEDS